MKQLSKIFITLLTATCIFGLNSTAIYAETPSGATSGMISEPETSEPGTSTEDVTLITTDGSEVIIEESENTEEYTDSLGNEITDTDYIEDAGYATDSENTEDTEETDDTDDAEESADDEDSEPEMWPVYVSLGSIAAAIVIIFIINVTHRAKK